MNSPINTFFYGLGRAILGLFFVVIGVMNIIHWNMNLSVLLKAHFPLAEIALGIALAYEIIFGLLLTLGLWQKLSSCALILFSVISALIYLPFWTMTGVPLIATLTQFLSVIAVIGGLIITASSTKKPE